SPGVSVERCQIDDPHQSPIRIKAGRWRSTKAPDAQGVPETNRSNERVSNWKVHRTRGSPAGGRRPTPCGSRARRGIITPTCFPPRNPGGVEASNDATIPVDLDGG